MQITAKSRGAHAIRLARDAVSVIASSCWRVSSICTALRLKRFSSSDIVIACFTRVRRSVSRAILLRVLGELGMRDLQAPDQETIACRPRSAIALQLRQLSESLIGVCHRTWAGNVEGIQLTDAKSSSLNECVNLAVQMTSTGNEPSGRRKPVLPGHYAGLGRAAVFDKKKLAIRLKNSSHLAERLIRIGNGTERPGHDDGVDTRFRDRQTCSTDWQRNSRQNIPRVKAHRITRET